MKNEVVELVIRTEGICKFDVRDVLDISVDG